MIKEKVLQGKIQTFHGGGGGGGGEGMQKIMCMHAYYEREAQNPLWPRSRAHLRALEALGFFMHSCAI